MPMNQSQKRYALERIEEIRRDHRSKIDEEAKAKVRQPLSIRDKIILIRNRKAKFIRPDIPEENTHGNRFGGPLLVECYEYPQEAEIEAHNSTTEQERKYRQSALHAEWVRLRDSVNLGDTVIKPEDLEAFEKAIF